MPDAGPTAIGMGNHVDVFDPEPFGDHEIIHLENVFLSPHIAGETTSTYFQMFKLMVDEFPFMVPRPHEDFDSDDERFIRQVVAEEEARRAARRSAQQNDAHARTRARALARARAQQN